MGSRTRFSIDHRVKRSQKALEALELSVVTQADKQRIAHIWDGLHALDEEQSNLKAALDLAFGQNQDVGHVTEAVLRDVLTEQGITWKLAPQPGDPQETK